MRIKSIAAAIAAVALLVCLPAIAAADTVTVSPGGNIQNAVNSAHPGDTIKLKSGTYDGNVQVKKDDIEIRGEGKSTKLVQPATPGECPGFGICVANQDANGKKISDVDDVEISHLRVDGYEGFGIIGFGTRNIEIHHVWAANNGEYGIATFESSGIELAWNTTDNDGEAGLYVGDSPQANAAVHHNESTGSEFGILVRDASHGIVKSNELSGNCVGILVLSTGSGNGFWKVKGNKVVGNSKACPAVEEVPPFSGIGIAVLSAHDIWISKNKVLDNKPTGPSVASGGIVVGALGAPGTGPAVRIHVTKNVVLGNEPVDLLWDKSGTGNAFERNVCETSDPAGLCKKGGKGDDEHGEDDDHHKGDGDHHKGDDDHHKGDKDDDHAKPNGNDDDHGHKGDRDDD
jgi:hypothetical protein